LAEKGSGSIDTRPGRPKIGVRDLVGGKCIAREPHHPVTAPERKVLRVLVKAGHPDL